MQPPNTTLRPSVPSDGSGVEARADAPAPGSDTYRVGDRVRYVPTGKVGSIVQVRDGGRRVEVIFGVGRAPVECDGIDLAFIEPRALSAIEDPRTPLGSVVRYPEPPPSRFASELDVATAPAAVTRWVDSIEEASRLYAVYVMALGRDDLAAKYETRRAYDEHCAASDLDRANTADALLVLHTTKLERAEKEAQRSRLAVATARERIAALEADNARMAAALRELRADADAVAANSYTVTVRALAREAVRRVDKALGGNDASTPETTRDSRQAQSEAIPADHSEAEARGAEAAAGGVAIREDSFVPDSEMDGVRQRDLIGQRLAASGAVTRTEDGFDVAELNCRNPGRFRVWRGEDGRVRCSCIGSQLSVAARYQCEHIRAVKHFLDGLYKESEADHA